MNFKWLRVPFSNATKEVKVAQLWEVRWFSLKSCGLGIRYPESRPEIEAFTSKEEAMAFTTSLENAVKLLRHKMDYQIEIEKGKSGD